MALAPKKSPSKRKPAAGAKPRPKAVAKAPPVAKDEAPPEPVYDPAIGSNIKTLAQVGTPKVDIARVLKVSVGLIEKLYRDDWEDGHAGGNVRLRQSGFQQAVGRPAEYDDKGRLIRAELAPDKSMAIFLHKARLGYKEIQGVEHTGKDGGPITTSDLDLSVLTDEEYDLFKALFEKASRRAAENRAEAEASGRKPT